MAPALPAEMVLICSVAFSVSCSAIFKWVVSAHFPGLCPEVGAEAWR